MVLKMIPLVRLIVPMVVASLHCSSAIAAEPGDADDPLATVKLPDDIVARKAMDHTQTLLQEP